MFSGVVFGQGGPTGPTEVTVNESHDYVFSDDIFIANPTWSVTNGYVTNSWQSSINYYATVLWNTAGSGTVKFKDGSTVLGSLSVTVSGIITFPPAAPVANAATNITTSSFTANWGGVPVATEHQLSGSVIDPTEYRLDVSTSETFSSFVTGYNNLKVTTTYKDVTGLSSGTTYHYRVRAVNSSGTSPNSNVITVPTIPAAPVANAATNITTSSFTANWGSVTGATEYRLDVSTSNTFSSFVTGYNNLQVTTTNKDVTGLSSGTTYHYRVRAANSSGTSPNSNVITVTTSLVGTICTSLVGLNIQATQYNCAIKFTSAKITDCLTTYLWDFGDGNTSAERNPIHAYANSGTYDVSLNISYTCSSCAGNAVLTKQVTYNSSGIVLEDQVVEVVTYQKPQVLSNSVSTFSDAWLLQHEASALDDKSGYLNGSEGVWRNDASFVYDTPRLLSDPVVTKTDGTYTLEQFNWQQAELNAIPNWIKATTMTGYSPYSYELENKDVLGVYSAALYDYGGQLPVANGVNMRNKEMAFTSFEELTGLPTGNWIFGTQPLPVYTKYTINAGYDNMAVVEAKLSQLAGVTKADVTGSGKYLKGNEIVCTTPHPSTDEWSMVVFKDSPSSGTWTGSMSIKNEVIPTVNADIDATITHTGKYSLKINAEQTFQQEILKLDSGKSYWVNGWVSINNAQVQTPELATNLGFDIIVKSKNGTLVSTFPFQPLGPIIEGWQQVKGVFNCSVNDAVIEIKFKPGSGGTAWYDDLRLHPETGNMKSYVYDLNNYRLRAILDEENFASYFYYDVEGNLYLTKKETKEGIKTLTENITYQVERDYQAILNYAVLQGYALPSADQQIKQNQLLVDLKAFGIWPLLDVLYVFVTDGSVNFANINWKAPGTLQASGGTHSTNIGRIAATGITLGYIPATHGVNWTMNDASMVFVLDKPNTTTTNVLSAVGGIASLHFGDPIYWQWKINDAPGLERNAATGLSSWTNNLFQIQRTASNASRVLRNGTQLATNATVSSVLTSSALNILTAATLTYKLVAYGSSLSGNEVNFKTAWDAYFNSL